MNEVLAMNSGYTPYVVNGDCVDVMPTLDAGSFDLIVTSPPYDAEKEYEGKRDVNAYAKFAAQWIAEIPRLLAPNGSFWLNVGYTKLSANETLPLSYMYYYLKPANLKLIQEVVWHYEGGMSYKNRFTHRTERWLWFALDTDNVYFDLDAVRDMSLNRTNDKRNNPLGKNPSDYWYFDRVVGGTAKGAEKTAHPCQFPEKMIERIVKACSPKSGVILDPFAGSGTTGRVAEKLDRFSMLIEKNTSYLTV